MTQQSKDFRFLFAALAIFFFPAVFTGPSATADDVAPSGGMMRFPDVSATQIVFVYANDLWLVPREGGQAVPLASPPGAESFPKFSSDGKQIAFIGNYEGNTDLYTIPSAGGIAQRITYHPAGEQLCDWAPDGRLIFSSNGWAGLSRQTQLFLTSQKQPLPEKLPVPYGSNAAISPDGHWLAYNPYSRDFRTWKRYRGGMASDIWLFNLKTHTSQQITDFEGTDTLPMWHNQTVFYLSDDGESHRLNIWAYDSATGARRQVTRFSEWDVKWPSIGPGDQGQGEIVFQYGGQLWLLNLADESHQAVKVTIPGDKRQLRTKAVDAGEFIAGGNVSPTGKRVVVEARGDIWTLPAENGSPRNLTRTSGIAERDPSWSPDGRWIAYMADVTGEYELYVTQSDGRGETKRLTNDGTVFRYGASWSPDSRRLVFTDKTGALFLHTLESGETRQVDVDPWARPIQSSWSADSRWLAYSKQTDTRSGTPTIWIYDAQEGQTRQVSDGFFPDRTPVFDRRGDYLFFVSSRSFESPKYEDLGTTFIYSGTEVLMAMPLRSDVKNPLLATSDEETWGDNKDNKDNQEGDSQGDEKKDDAQDGDDQDDDAKDDEKDEDDNDNQNDDASGKDRQDEDDDKQDKSPSDKSRDGAKPKRVEIAWDGLAARAFRLPVPSGNLGELAVNAKGQLIYSRTPGRGADGTPSIKLFDLDAEDKGEQDVVDGAGRFTISADGKKLLVQQGRSTFLIDAAAGQKLAKPVSTDGMTVMIDPREEWRQMFVDAWRIQRDFFYDPTMHGVDWMGIRKHYEQMLDDCTSREDLSFVIGEMISELNVGHAYYSGGDTEEGPRVDVGMPGCRFERDGDAYRIAELYTGASWDIDARNPLTAVGVKQGEYLLAVNGRSVTIDKDPFAAFQGLAGKTVTLTIGDAPRAGDQRQVVIRLPGSDNELRYRQWIERNRKYVEDKTDGRVGYIYVPNTGVNGQDDLFRQFAGQLHKDALIIDERWNGGGQIPTRFIELLNRPVTNYWARRDGRDWTWPPDAHQGPKCMLINGLAGSGGDMFPALFRQAGIGKLIGRRTWGGLVGISGNPQLIDGGRTTAPTFAYYEKDGTWGIEGHGVEPDIEVVDDPARMVDGGDPQLDAAIQLMLEQLKTNPYQAPQRPAYPNRSRFGIAPEDK